MTKMKRITDRFMNLCMIVLAVGGITLTGTAALAAPANEAPTALRAVPAATAPQNASTSEVASYAKRDQKAPKELAKFAGGDTLVIGATSAVLIVLLVVLLVLLLR